VKNYIIYIIKEFDDIEETTASFDIIILNDDNKERISELEREYIESFELADKYVGDIIKDHPKINFTKLDMADNTK